MTRSTSVRAKLGVLGAAAGAALALTIFTAVPASAHVGIDGDATAAVGSTAAITFRVPTESDTATTVGVKVTFPEKTPFSSVQPLYKPGWHVKVDSAKLPAPVKDGTGEQITSYVRSVTWTAAGRGIPSELYDTFTVRAGAVPETKSVALPAVQTYSDGSTVDWSQIAQGGAEPQHPAPLLTVVPARDSTASPPASAGPSIHQSPSGDGGAGVRLGVGGLLAGVLALIVAVVALVRANRKSASGQ